jgi:hypothetical protein
MAELKVDISELKSEGGDVIKELSDKEGVSKPYLRVLLRKFLHKTELKDYFKVIGGKEDTLFVKEKKAAEEEE